MFTLNYTQSDKKKNHHKSVPREADFIKKKIEVSLLITNYGSGAGDALQVVTKQHLMLVPSPVEVIQTGNVPFKKPCFMLHDVLLCI